MNAVLLHLSLIDGIGPATVKRLLEAFTAGPLSGQSLEKLYSFNRADIMYYGQLSQDKAQMIVRGLADHALLAHELSLIKQHDIDVVTLIEEHYPAQLKNIYVPPLVLYSKGLADLLCTKQVGIIGSRKADAYGYAVIQKLIPGLVHAQWTIVSGGALGIDSMAHRASLDAGGITCVVLGSGLLKPYPASNKDLFKRIIDNGGILVSSFPLMTGPRPGLFPQRNRIIAGLSRGCIVVQAGIPSGALITAQYAVDEGREVCAVPGAIDNPLSAGCHKLIAQGATPVTSAQDILCALGEHFSEQFADGVRQ